MTQKPSTHGPGLGAPGLGQIALGLALAKREARRIAQSRLGAGMANQQNATPTGLRKQIRCGMYAQRLDCTDSHSGNENGAALHVRHQCRLNASIEIVWNCTSRVM